MESGRDHRDMRVLITGASGLIGRSLTSFWLSKAYTVYQVSRNPDRRNAFSLGYEDSMPEVDVIVNLAGELVVGYWTESKKKRILQSRMESTQWVVDRIHAAKVKPKQLITASAVGIYGDQGDEVINERSVLDPEGEFRYQVCKAWEAVAGEAKHDGVRVTKVRIGNVFAWKERFLGYVHPFWKCGIFPRLSTPETWIPWISLRDLVRMIDWILNQMDSPEMINGVAPYPFQWSEFERVIRQYYPIKMTVPIDRLGMSVWMGEMAQAVQDSQRIVSSEATLRGFEFLDDNFERYLRGAK